jgi:asparagine synthase (glutamine-hydrolysing)
MYFCALRPSGETIQKADLFGHIARLRETGGGSFRSVLMGPFAAIVAERPGSRPLVAHTRAFVAAGDVRLDNRAEIAALSERPLAADASDLDIVIAAIDAVGESCIGRIIGDYAFVLWDARAQKLLAVRDAFGVKPLYHRSAPGLQLFSSRIAPLHPSNEFDQEFIADFILGINVGTTRTVWSEVDTVPAGSIMRYRGTTASTTRHWSALEHARASSSGDAHDADRFRELLTEAVRLGAAGESGVWAQLSGGLDSSSIVAIAKGLGDQGVNIDGTVTVVDSLGDGDERGYSDLVVDQCGLPNHQIKDFWAWRDIDRVQVTDEPFQMYPFFARDARMRDLVSGAGGRIMLSGMGSDHYLVGTLDYISDLAAKGHVRTALREVLAWSMSERQSFWRLTHQELIKPLLPFGRNTVQAPAPPSWLQPQFAKRCDQIHATRVAPGNRFATRTATALGSLPGVFERWPFNENIEMRYPFLYRPLVEFSLGLPVNERIRPGTTKWILREAMRGVVPEKIRTRSSKGAFDARILWSLTHERARIESLLKSPILGDLGCIDPIAFRKAVEGARTGIHVDSVTLFSALSLETWLSARAGSTQGITAARSAA